MLVQQAYRPTDVSALQRTITLIDKLADAVNLYRLGCNVVRDGKELDFGSFGYRLYVFLWCGLFPVRAFILRIKH